jgi:hypothetical protein
LPERVVDRRVWLAAQKRDELAVVEADRDLPEVAHLEHFSERLRSLFAFRCDSDVGQYAALRAGFGIGVCQVALAKRDGLVPIMPGALDWALDTWVVMHRDLKGTRRMRLMFDHLAALLKTYVASEG